MSILDEIFAHTRLVVAAAQAKRPHAELEAQLATQRKESPAPPDFVAALRNPVRPAPRLIAEVKQRSPSKGVLCDPFDPLCLATIYAENGAAAVSVLTDEKYFGGNIWHLYEIAQRHPDLPLLRKDFIFDRYQLLQAALSGASAALLIVAMLNQNDLETLIAAAKALDLAPLVEVHTRAELDRALMAGATLIGINNRNLHTFETDLQVTAALHAHLPDYVTLVAESGIKTTADVAFLADLGVHAMLIGEGLVTAPDVAVQVRRLAQIEEQPQ